MVIVFIVGDFLQTNKQIAGLLEKTVPEIEGRPLDRNEFRHTCVPGSRFIFTFPRQERYLIYDERNTLDSFYNEINSVKVDQGQDQFLILVLYKEETQEDRLYHPKLEELWFPRGPQAGLDKFAEAQKFLSIKDKFNIKQVEQICRQFDIKVKV
jgi:hypothetical protein